MKLCKKIVSLILAVLMATSALTAVDFSAHATEATPYLSDDDVMWFTNKFLYTMTESEKAVYGDILKKMNPDVEWSGSEFEKVKFCADKLQSYWGKISPLLPSTITDSELVQLGGNTCKYFSSTIGVLKNLYYIKNTDNNNIEKAYHYLKSFNSICGSLGWSLGSLGMILTAIEVTLPIADILYSSTCTESLQFYEAELQIEYYDPTNPDFTTPDKATLMPAFQSLIKDEKYEQGLNALYIKYSLMRMSDNIKNISVNDTVSGKYYYGGHTYQFFNTKFSSFEEAEAYCESLGGHLAVIESEDEDKNVYGFLRSLGEMNAFLGVKEYTEGVWTDVYGNILNENSYTNWGSGEPNNSGGNENVLQYYKNYPNGEWNDLYWGKEGIYSFICEWDSYIDPYPTINDEHHYEQTIVAPTCTQNGYTLNKCKDCGLEFYSNSVYKLGHDFAFNKNVSPTCTAKGYDLYKCSRCSQTQQKNIVSELGHDYQYSNVVSPTCTDKGYDLYLCTRCGQGNKVKYVDALGHNYVFTSHKDPTCNSKGYDEYTCSRCNGTKRDEIAALDGSALKSALNNAIKRIESGVYTDESVSACQTVYDKYKNALDEFHSQTDVDNATAEVTSACENLMLKDIVTGTLDNGMTWTFTKDGAKLSFAGEGEVPKFELGSSPWYYCGYIETLEFGEDITSIAGYAFTGYNSVKKINFPSTLTTINIRAFEYCYAVEELIIPDSVTFIGFGTFASLTSLKKVTVPASVGYASYAFEHDEQVEKIIVTPGVDGIMPECTRVDNVGWFFVKVTGAFGPWRNANNATVDIQDGVKSIGKNTFFGAKISQINISDSVKEIGYQALKTSTNTDAYVYNSDCVIDEANTCLSNVNIMIKNSDNEFVKKEHTHTWSAWKYNNDSVYNSLSDYTNGTQTRTCTVCGENETVEASNTALLRRRGNALSLESSITLTTYITKDVVDYYDEVYAEITRNSTTQKVYSSGESLTSGSTVYYVFDYDGISPQTLGDNINITFYGVKDGVTYNGNTYEYSPANYISSTLKSTTSAKLKTLLVDLVYYGEACQVYQNYKTDNLLTDILTDEQKALRSTADLNLTNIKNAKYSLCENRFVKFGTALRLNNSVEMAIPMNMTDVTLDELSLKVKVGSRTMTYTYSKNPENFEKGSDGYWYFYFDGIYANQMSDEVFITAYKDDEQVSYTLKYSIESYASTVTDAKLKAVTDAMMRYGISAKAYAGK